MSQRFAGVSAWLIDLDGTLIDSVPDLATAVDRMLIDLGFAAAGEPRVRTWVGEGSRRLVQSALAAARGVDPGAITESELEAALQRWLHHYDDCCLDRSVLYPGVRDTLQRWHGAGIRLACVTNKPMRFTRRLLDHFELAELMPVAVAGDTLPTRKPAPEMLWHACEQLGVAPAASAMLGDSRNDVLAARTAGMPVACVSYGYNHGRPIALEQPDCIVDSFAELP
jgi:phosphoglycolate phosphatase